MKVKKGMALHVGLNSVDPSHYQGWSGPLTACEADAQDMLDIAKSKGFTSKMLLTKEATRAKVTNAITTIADNLESGDIFLLSYSGHGGQLPDLNGDEPDGMDETWCLYDGQLVDDEIFNLLGKFKKGVRIFVLSDSCHSGSVVKMAYSHGKNPTFISDSAGNRVQTVYRAMPNDIVLKVYNANKSLYDPILSDKSLKDALDKVDASVLLISGCQDNQLSADGAFNGLFTGTLLQVWAGGKFKGNYKKFHKSILARMPGDQSPNYFIAGAPNPQFQKEIPFTI